MIRNEEKYCSNCKKQTNHVDGICQVCNQSNNALSIVRKVLPAAIVVLVIVGIALFMVMKNDRPQTESKNETVKVTSTDQDISKSEPVKLSPLDQEINNFIHQGQINVASADSIQQIQSNFDVIKKGKVKKRGNVYIYDNNGTNKVTIISNIDNEAISDDDYSKIAFNINRGNVIVFNYDFNVHVAVIDKQTAAFNNFKQSLIKNEETIDRIYILGHTDNVGSDEYNNNLSVNRCLSLGQELMSKGLKVKNIGFGKSRPITTNASDNERAENRRIEIIIVKK